MIKKKEKIRWMPPLQAMQDSGRNYHGWLIIDRNTWEIIKWHSFDDFGTSLETLVIERDGETKEVYSYDEGETFTFELYEG